jgi:hypothetical protein
MQDETKEKASMTVGGAVDRVLEALRPLDDQGRQSVLLAVFNELKIELTGGAQQKLHPGSPEGALPPSSTVLREGGPVTDIRSFAQEKAPSTAVERVALVAYYVSELAPKEERKNSIDKKDLVMYFKQAGFPLPKRPEQALVNTRHAGYLDPLGDGKYRLNAVGHNLVAHGLPRLSASVKPGKRRTPHKQRKPVRR